MHQNNDYQEVYHNDLFDRLREEFSDEIHK